MTVVKKSDFLVIGSGISGLNYTLNAAKHGSVVLITKKELVESNTNYAQGGIAAVIDKNDSFESHIADTLKTGCGLCNPNAVKVMVEEAPQMIKELIDYGVGFNKVNGELSLSREGGHSKKRIVHSKDATGKEVERALAFNVRNNENIIILESHLAVDLIVQDGRCVGAYCINRDTQKIEIYLAKAVCLATGGFGQIYSKSSNPKIATGDGVAMAYNVGAVVVDIEFMQFHPTTLDKKDQPHYLISETVRGEGGVLLNNEGEYFMKKFHEMGDLAPRDIVTRAIVKEEKNGQVFLDIRHKGKEYIKKRFPTIFEQLWWHGVRMDTDKIPITPAAHYSCGGIKTDLFGRSTVDGLFAFGEVTCTGVHGANRLASNSLLESLVFSKRALISSVEYVKNNKIDLNVENLMLLKYNKQDAEKLNQIKERVQQLMWEKVGIVKSDSGLSYAVAELEKIGKEVDDLCADGIDENLVELRNIALVAKLVTTAASMRKESRGTHYNVDYPDTEISWEKHIELKK